MPDNVTVTEAVAGDAPPPLSVSNWPGDQPAAVAPPVPGGDNAGDASTPPADGGTPPATVETPPAEGAGGEAGTGDTPAADGNETGDPADAAAGESGAGVEAGGKPDRSLAGRLGQRTRERNEIRAERDQLAALLEKAIEKLGDGTAAKPPTDPAAPGTTPTPQAQAEQPDPRPRRDAFDDPDAYDEAVDQWNHRQSARLVQRELDRREAERKAAEEKAQREQGNRAFHDQRVTAWNERVAELKKSAAPDFEERAYSEDVQVTQAMSSMLLTLDKGPDVLLYLADHPEEAAEIAKMTAQPGQPGFNPQRALIKLGVIEDRLANARPQVSKTPAPIRPIGNSNRAGPKAPDEMSMEEYAAARTPVIRAERSGTMFGNRRA